MVLKRVMPCLLYDGAALVKTVRFAAPRYVGDPVNAVRIFNEKEVDELVLLDIAATRQGRGPDWALVEAVASECFMPLAYGGGVRTVADAARLVRLGVEKVVLNTVLLTDPDAAAEIVREFGSSSVVGSVDYRAGRLGGPRVHAAAARRPRFGAGLGGGLGAGLGGGPGVVEHCRAAAERVGVGELLLTAVDRDGTWSGFDVETVRAVAGAVSVPIIASGGAGSVAHLTALFARTPATGAAIGSMAVYQRQGMGVLINFPARAAVLGPDA